MSTPFDRPDRVVPRRALRAAVALTLTLAAACDYDSVPPESSRLHVVVTTTGGDPDLDGYGVVVNGEPRGAIGANGQLTVFHVPAGPTEVVLTGVEANCEQSPNPAHVLMRKSAASTVHILVECLATGVEVRVAATGLDPPGSGFGVLVDGASAGRVPVPGARVVSRLAPGLRVVSLGDVAPNCALEGPSAAEVGVVLREVTPADFSASCTATRGSIEVEVTASGADRPATFSVHESTGQTKAVARGGTVVFDLVDAGARWVTVTGARDNCDDPDGHYRAVTVAGGGFGRDTARVAYAFHCAPYWGLTFARGSRQDYYDPPHVMLMPVDDDHHPSPATVGLEPAWSPDGGRLAFRAAACSMLNCQHTGIRIWHVEDSAATALTDSPGDGEPAWSPDGQRIAFERRSSSGDRRVLVVDVDGDGDPALVPLGHGLLGAGSPAWSPDGERLAFVCEVEAGNRDICVAEMDGSGLVRLTDHPAPDEHPRWSPDGDRILFTTTRYTGLPELVTVDAGGGAPVRMAPGMPALHPSWHADGSRIAFVGFECSESHSLIYCHPNGIATMATDGTDLVRTTFHRDDRWPAPRP